MSSRAFPYRDLFRISENDLYGYIDITGRQVIPFQFHEAGNFSDGLANVMLKPNRRTRQVGYIDTRGEVVIGWGAPPGYKRAEKKGLRCSYYEFREGLARFHLGDSKGYSGYIDRSGKAVIPADFRSTSDFSEGLGRVTLPDPDDPDDGDTSMSFVDHSGQMVFPQRPEIFSSFVDSMCTFGVYIDDRRMRYGAINRAGKTVIPPIYQSLEDYCEGMARVGQDTDDGRKWGFVDKRGKLCVPMDYLELEDSSSGMVLAAVAGSNGLKYFYLDPAGMKRLPFEFTMASSFSNGVALVGRGGRTMLIDTEGRELAPVDIDPARLDSVAAGNGFFVVRCRVAEYETIWGIVDRTGKIVVPIEYDWIDNFHSGLCFAVNNETKAYFNARGEIVWSASARKKDPLVPELAEFLQSYLHALNLEWQSHEEKWDGYSQILLFACRTSEEELLRWFQSNFQIHLTADDGWRNGSLTVYFHPDEKGRSVSICAANTESGDDGIGNLTSYVASDRLRALSEKHRPCIVGAIFMEEKD